MFGVVVLILLTKTGKKMKVSAMQQKDRHSFATHRLLLAATGVGLALLVFFVFLLFGVRRHTPPDTATTAVAPPHVVSNRFSRTVVEGFRLDGGPGTAPFPLIALGACRVARPRLGGFRLGLGEVLELDRLELNLPLDFPAAGTNAAQTVNTLLSHSLDMSSFRRMAHVVAPVSSATVTGLRISLIHGTNRSSSSRRRPPGLQVGRISRCENACSWIATYGHARLPKPA